MSAEALPALLSGLGAEGDMLSAAANAAVLLALAAAVAAAVAYWRGRARPAVPAEENAAPRAAEFDDIRVRLVALERQAEETRQALAARAAMDAAGPPPAALQAAGPVVPPAPAVDAAARPRALVCSADGALARIFESLFKTRGFEVVRCADGIDAAALAAHQPPSVAILDLAAAGDDKAAIVRAVRVHLARGGKIYALARDEAEAARAGVGDAERLLKPVDFMAVARMVRGGASQGVKR